MFRTIILAYDGSDHAKRAVPVACDVALRYGAALWLCHTPEGGGASIAVDPFVGAIGAPPSPEELAASAKIVLDEAEAMVVAAGAKVVGRRVGSVAASDDVAALAEELKADLIVMGRRGRGAVAGLLFGSASQEVQRSAPCAVLTVI